MKPFLRCLSSAAIALAGVGAAADEAPKFYLQKYAVPTAGETLPKWQSGELQVHLVYTGRGESLFFIFPDGTTMLLDAGLSGPHKRPAPEKLAGAATPGDAIARYVERVSPAADPSRVDYLMISHYHDDHANSMLEVAKTLHFGVAFDRTWPDLTYPCRLADYDKDGSSPILDKLYKDLIARDGTKVEKFRVGERDQLKLLHGGADGFSVYNLCANGFIANERTGEITDCYATYPDKQPGFAGKQWINENGMSLGMIVRYGDFSLYTAGDFSDEPYGVVIEDLMAKVVPQVTVAKINHHGFKSMTRSLVAALSPRAWLSHDWNENQNGEDTVERTTDPALAPRLCIYAPSFMSPSRPCPFMPQSSYKGAHVVLTVPKDGKAFTIAYVTADDESMRVLERFQIPF